MVVPSFTEYSFSLFPPSEQGLSSAFPLFRLLLSFSRVFRPQRAGTIGNCRGFRFRQYSESRPRVGPAPTLRRLVSGPRVLSFACAARTGEVWHITACILNRFQIPY